MDPPSLACPPFFWENDKALLIAAAAAAINEHSAAKTVFKTKYQITYDVLFNCTVPRSSPCLVKEVKTES